MPAVLGRLSKQLCLQHEDFIKDAICSPALETMVGNHTRTLEMAAQGFAERSVDARLAPQLGLFEELKAAIERKLPGPVCTDLHLRPCRAPRHARQT